MMNSDRSSTGKNADPTVRIGGTTRGSTTNVATPATMIPARIDRLNRLVTMPNTMTPMPANPANKPVTPRVGSRNEAKNVPAAMTIIAARWSSAQAMTFL